MVDYSTTLKTWGDSGVEYPDGYSYLEGEQPVDSWDNYLKYNTVKDIQHLISLTNKRIESSYGGGADEPTSPGSSFLYYDTDNEELKYWDSTASMWNRLLSANGDTLAGALNFDGHAAQNVGSLSMSGTADLDGNNLVDETTTIWDSTNGYIPQGSLENDSLTVAGKLVSLGGSTSLGISNLDDTNLSGVDLLDDSTTVWDTSSGEVPQNVLGGPASSLSSYPLPAGDLAEDYALTSRFPLVNSDIGNSSVTVTAGNQLLGGGSVSLGGSVTVDVDDGSGSGLDADLLDGNQASSFFQSSGDVDHDSTTGGTDSDAHHTRYADSEAVTAVDGEVDNSATTVAGLDDAVSGKAESSEISPIQASSDVDHDSVTGVSANDHHTAPTAGTGLTDEGDNQFGIAVDSFKYDPGMVEWEDGLADEEVARIQLQAGEELVIERIEFQQKGGGSSTSADLDVRDVTAATTVGTQDLGGVTKDAGTSGSGNTVIIRLTNSTGGVLNANPRITGYITGA